MNKRTIIVLTALSLLAGLMMQGRHCAVQARRGAATPAAHAVEQVPHRLNLQAPRALRAATKAAQPESQAAARRALTLAAYDFDADGAPELVSGYATAQGGVLLLSRGNPEAFAPSSPEALREAAQGHFPEAFLPKEAQARTFELPAAPDFLGVGDFDRDGNFDLLAAARGGQALYLLAGDGQGAFAAAQLITLLGRVTALATGEFDLLDGRADVLVGVANDEGWSLLIFKSGVTGEAPLTFALPAEATALATGQLDRDAALDLALVAGGRVWILHGELERRATAPQLAEVSVPGFARELALGDFIRDRDNRTEMAVLTTDGGLQILARGELDTRPVTEQELRANIARYGRGRSQENPGPLKRVIEAVQYAAGLKDDSWQVAESLTGATPGWSDSAQAHLLTARLSGGQAEDLLVLDGAQLNLLAARGKAPEQRALSTLSKGAVVAALPLRLNVLAQPGLVLLPENGAPVLAPAALMASFTVTKTADTNDGVCDADCSLREAIRAANAAAGADMIMVPAGTYTLTIAGNNENAAATGDLDITDAVTITGAGAATTIIQAGASAGAGIDKVFSINPSFTSAFAASLSGLTIRFGKNTSGFSGDGFGGGLDWDGSGTGTLSITNCVITQNTTADGDGGGLTLSNGSGSNPVTTVTITGSTISSNQPARSGAASPLGGGIFVGIFTSVNLTNCTLTGNNVNGSGGVGEGGGYFSFSQTTEALELHACTVSNNQAPSHGGGVRSAQRTTIDQNSVISGNTSGGQGGGLFHNQNNATASLITKTTFLNNSATTSGGGLRLGSSMTNNSVNISFCRFAGNTAPVGSGLAVFNGVATAENNWWGCNSGPGGAPCQRAQIEMGGTGSLDFTPWIVLSFTSSPTALDLPATNSSTLTASFLQNSAGGALAASNLDVLIGLPVTFSNPAPVLGNISAAQSAIQANGTATATYTATMGGTEGLEVSVDGGVATLSIGIQAPPTITGVAALSRTQGVAASNSQIATVSDANQAANTLAVTINSATVNGVTVNNITINGSGQVFADVVASCTATNASFTLTVTDSTSKTATTGLTVNVSNNPPPVLGTYPTTNVALNSSTTATPSVAPSDNGSVASVAAAAPGFTGTFSGNALTGVITVTNAGPAGSYTVTVTATDNCGTTATTTFTLTVNSPPQITGATISRQQGNSATSVQIATVSDVNQAANTLVVTVNNAASATVNGVTVASLSIDGAGNVTASVGASCTATNASFTLTVTDNQSATATASLIVNVAANSMPTLGTYPTTNVTTGGSTTVTPNAAPSDNGSVTSVTAAAPGFTGTFSGNALTGVITVTNAGPAGSYTVTVTATDNCGTTATTTFTLAANSPPQITGAMISRQQGSPASNSQIATVSDANQAANTLAVTVNSATVNGVTVNNITINGAGQVFADVVAACTALNASFTLTVTDNQNATATATLAVTANLNTAPTLGTYSASTTLGFGAGTSLTPGSAPADNGSLATLTASAPGFNGALAVNLATGVVTVSNAMPAGSFTVTVTATDNCGAPSQRSFTLVVNCPTLVEVLPKPSGPLPGAAFALPAAKAGQFYTTTISANPAGGNYSFSLTPSPNQLPAGLTLNPGTGVISGTTTAVGNYVFRIYATPAGGCAGASRLYSLRVNP